MTGIRTHTLLLTTPVLGSGELDRSATTRNNNLICTFVLFYYCQRKNGEFDEEALEFTNQLLSANPDYYSLWNYRREIFLELTKTRFVNDPVTGALLSFNNFVDVCGSYKHSRY